MIPLLLLLCACGPDLSYDVPLAPDSPWPKFRRTPAQDGRGVGRADEGAGTPWAFQTDKGIFSSPVIGGDGTIYVGSADRTFYALDPDGHVAWTYETGEIIDSSALLDDAGRVVFGSGDGHLYALDAATGEALWILQADDPAESQAFIRWFEGNVALLPGGDLVVPNDNFHVYAVDRDTGEVRWRFRTLDQTWSLPAVEAATGHAFFGNNNLLGVGDNTFALDGATGEALWARADSLGSVAASPLLDGDQVVVGGFDGILRAYTTEGTPRWTFAARDHLYASPGLLSDGTIVQPGADGTVYGLDPDDGAVRWAFDTPEPIRSSPAVGADDVVYFGGGDGRLYALDPDGTLRWSMRLATGDRNDLNASPALGWDGVVIAGESGEVFFVPYDWCLRQSDPRCDTGGEALAEDAVRLVATSRYGSLLLDPPEEVGPMEPLALSLVAREGGDTVLALLDTASVQVEVTPEVPVEVQVSADRRFLVLTPGDAGWAGDTVAIAVSATVLRDPLREGLRFEGGTPAGTVSASLSLAVDRGGPDALPGAAPGATWELYRMAAPLPTILPSYNQIGFDSLHYLVSLVEVDGDEGVAWVLGATQDGAPDPATRAMFPARMRFSDGGMVLHAARGMSLEVMSAAVGLDDFRVHARLDDDGAAVDGAVLTVRTACGNIAMYGSFLRRLGMCNPDTDALTAFGAALLEPRGLAAGADPGPVAFSASGGRLAATLAPSFAASDHRLALLALDAATGDPLPLAYGTGTAVTTSDGAITVSLPASSLPDPIRVWLMIDGRPAASETLPTSR